MHAYLRAGHDNKGNDDDNSDDKCNDSSKDIADNGDNSEFVTIRTTPTVTIAAINTSKLGTHERRNTCCQTCLTRVGREPCDLSFLETRWPGGTSAVLYKNDTYSTTYYYHLPSVVRLPLLQCLVVYDTTYYYHLPSVVLTLITTTTTGIYETENAACKQRLVACRLPRWPHAACHTSEDA